MIKRFNKVEGRYIEKIYGQNRFGYSQSDFEDLYDMIEWAKRGGYQGSELLIYDFTTGKVYKPFNKKRNVVYGAPVYVDEFLYFLQGDYDNKKITLYRYIPEKISFPIKENESVILIENGKVYLDAWIEEGWDDENDCATDEYKYYNRIIIKDFGGNIISEEIGCLNKSADGDWWIA
ncbi:MAG: hypothetical protein SOV90_04305 [Lachnospiraceae bacterium]|nr:hypothetical protein [Clostridiales bacterium]MDD6293241.1 hypothetical protein [Eubacteriales bacterium]MDY2607137.1 hypothetical protein [Lachnospiraceae bacterium]